MFFFMTELFSFKMNWKCYFNSKIALHTHQCATSRFNQPPFPLKNVAGFRLILCLIRSYILLSSLHLPLPLPAIQTYGFSQGIRPKKRNCLFPVKVRKNRVGRLVKNVFFCIIFLVKNVCFMHVLC